MTSLKLAQNIFWIHKNDTIQVILEDQNCALFLHGVAAEVFEAVADSKNAITTFNDVIVNNVISDLVALKLIESTGSLVGTPHLVLDESLTEINYAQGSIRIVHLQPAEIYAKQLTSFCLINYVVYYAAYSDESPEACS